MQWGLEHISSQELSEWMIFDQEEPIGELRADYRAGQITAMIAETHRDQEKRSQPFTPQEFMPFLEEEEKPEKQPMTWEMQLAMVELWNEALGGSDLREGVQ